MAGRPAVFISYPRKHDESVALVVELELALLQRGLDVLRDVDIEPGSRWSEDLWHWLMECSGAVAIVTDAAAASDWCRREWSVLAARESVAALRVVPVRIEPSGPEANILDHLQAVMAKRGNVERTILEVVEALEGLGAAPPSPTDYLAAHQAWLNWQFAEASALGGQPFALEDVYVDTECGVLTWGQLKDDRTVDPFIEEHGGRVDLIETTLGYLGRPDFRDLVVVQGPAGSGKSAYCLRLAKCLVDEGLTPLLVRFRDLRLSSYEAIDDMLQDAIRIAPIDEHPPPLTDALFSQTALAEPIRFGQADICRLVLILDGWDEVALTGSTRFKQQIDEFLPRLRQWFTDRPGLPVRVVITGRPSAVVDRSGTLRTSTPVLTLRPMRPAQLRKYASRINQQLVEASSRPGSTAWSLDLARCERAFSRYDTWFRGQGGAETEVLGSPLLALLAFRTIAEWPGDIDELFAHPTALYHALIDLVAAHAGRAEPAPEGTVHRGGRTLRRLLQAVAAIITSQGSESASFGELERRLEGGHALEDWAEQATVDHDTLHELVVNFYFKGHPELGCEFLHKSFREYLYAEAIVDALEEASVGQVGPHPSPQREWGQDFQPDSVHYRVSRSLTGLLGGQWLTPEVRGHMFWLIERRTRTDPERWTWVRDLLNDVYSWWGEGVHLRGHPERQRGRDEWVAPPILDMIKDQIPWDDRHWPYSPSTASLDAYVGNALIQLTAFVHAHLANGSKAGERYCQTGRPGSVSFRPFNAGDAPGLIARMSSAPRRPSGSSSTGAYLRSVDLSNEDLDGVDLRSSILTNADMREASLRSANLSYADLTACRLTAANLNYASLRGVVLTGADLRDADLRLADIADANLTATDLTGAQLLRASLTAAKLTTADLSGANLTGASLSPCDLTSADLRSAKLDFAVLVGAFLGDADLCAASLRGVHLAGAYLGGARLAGADLTGVRYNSETIWPDGFDPPPSA